MHFHSDIGHLRCCLVLMVLSGNRYHQQDMTRLRTAVIVLVEATELAVDYVSQRRITKRD